MRVHIPSILLTAIYFVTCEPDTDKIVELLERDSTVENYTAVKQRIGLFIEPLEIKVHTNEDLLDKLTKLQANHPQITYLYEIGKSVEGRPLTVLAIGKYPKNHSPGVPEFKYIANIHGNEISGRELLLCLAEVLVLNYGKNEALTRLVNTTRIHLLPTMNPDGFMKAIPGNHDIAWLQGRANAAGLDLNRNFPQRLNRFTTLSVQPETRAVMQWTRYANGFFAARPIMPERCCGLRSAARVYLTIIAISFVLSANLHDGSLVVNYPYDDDIKGEGNEAKTGDHRLFVELSYSYARAHKFMWRKEPKCVGRYDEFIKGITNGNKWYSVSGGMQDWNYVFTNCFEVTIEMSCVKFPTDDQLKELWEEHKFALISFIEKIHNAVHGFVLEEITGGGIPNVRISINSIGKVITSGPDGDFWRLISPGEYNVTFEHEKYQTVVRPVLITKKKPYEFLNITMTRKKRFEYSYTHGVNGGGSNSVYVFIVLVITDCFHYTIS